MAAGDRGGARVQLPRGITGKGKRARTRRQSQTTLVKGASVGLVFFDEVLLGNGHFARWRWRGRGRGGRKPVGLVSFIALSPSLSSTREMAPSPNSLGSGAGGQPCRPRKSTSFFCERTRGVGNQAIKVGGAARRKGAQVKESSSLSALAHTIKQTVVEVVAGHLIVVVKIVSDGRYLRVPVGRRAGRRRGRPSRSTWCPTKRLRAALW